MLNIDKQYPYGILASNIYQRGVFRDGEDGRQERKKKPK
jgi:hypothetical protein